MIRLYMRVATCDVTLSTYPYIVSIDTTNQKRIVLMRKPCGCSPPLEHLYEWDPDFETAILDKYKCTRAKMDGEILYQPIIDAIDFYIQNGYGGLTIVEYLKRMGF